MPPGYNPDKRYKVTGHFDSHTRTMYFDMDTAVEDFFRQVKTK